MTTMTTMTTTSQKNKTIYDTPVRKTFNKTEEISSSVEESTVEEIPTGIVSMSLEEAISSNFEIAELQITEEELNKMSTTVIKDITEFGNFLESTPDIESIENGEIYDISDVPALSTNELTVDDITEQQMVQDTKEIEKDPTLEEDLKKK